MSLQKGEEMAQILEDVTQLSQDIGPRPAGTEEEQQAALYIADQFNSGAGMKADVEDFKCVPDYELVHMVLFGVALLAALVAFLLDVAAVPAIIVGLVATVLFVLELIDRPVVSRFFERGISQNVIARYVPPAAEGASSARRRKVILVAHYDSGRTMPEMVGPVVKFLPLFLKLSYAAMVLTPILLLIKHFAFAHSAGVLALVFNVLIIIGMVLILLSLGRAVLHRTQPYNDAANCNAAGVSVLMEVARRVAAGRVSEEEIAAREAVIHGEEAALEAGLVPEGARLTYEAAQKKGPEAAPQSEEARLASAKAAIAALTGKPVEGAAEVSSISENLVQVEPDLPVATDELRHEQNMEIMNAFTGGTAAASDHAESAEPSDESVDAESVQAEEESAGAEDAAGGTKSESGIAGAGAKAAVAGAAAAAGAAVAGAAVAATAAAKEDIPEDANVPDWYRKARQHAKREPENKTNNANAYRSRFAATLDATEEKLHEQDIEREEEARKETEAERQRQMIAEAAKAKDEAARRAEQERAAEEEAARQVEQLRAAQEQKAREEEARAEEARRAEQKRIEREQAERARAAQEEAARRAEEARRVEAARQEEARRAAEQRAAEERVKQAQETAREDVSHETPLPGATVAMQPVMIDREELAREAKAARQNVSRETVEPVCTEEQRAPESIETSEEPVAADVPEATSAMAPIDVSDLVAEMKGMKQDEPKAPAFITGEEESIFLPEDEAEEQAEVAQRAKVSYREPKPEPTPEETAAQRLVDPNAPFIPVIAEEDSAAAAKRAIKHEPLIAETTQKITLPELSEESEELPPIVESTKQRAPLADVTENKAKKAARSLLSTVLPEIGAKAKEATGAINLAAKKHLTDLPSLSGELRGMSAEQAIEEEPAVTTEETPVEQAPASQTGSLSTAGATGSFTAVGNDLVADADLDDMYVQDADDSEYAENFTETGAFAGPGYVEMPKSRMQKLFGKFGFGRKKKHEDELSAHEWLDVSDDFEARSVGQQRGGWESFQEGVDDEYYDEFSASGNVASDSRYMAGDDAYPADDTPLPANSPLRRGATFQDASLDGAFEEDVDDAFADGTKRWNGGAVSSDRASGEETLEKQPAEAEDSAEQEELLGEELKQIYQFRNPDIDAEVWFVALGAELSGNKGMKQFLADHASELKRAVVINLEGLGAGNLTYLQKEGVLKKRNASSRTKRSLRKASQATGVSCATSEIHWKESAASVAMSHRLQGMTLVGMEHGKPAYYGDALDTADEVSEETLQQNADFVLAMLKNI